MAGLRGIDNVVRNLNKEIKKIEGRTLRGLLLFAILIMNDTENTSPKTPLDTGNLRASRFIAASTGEVSMGSSPQFQGEQAGRLGSNHNSALQESRRRRRNIISVRIGFSAFYAFFVHEMVGANYQRPGSGAKFLESSIRNKQNEGLAIIAREARIR